MSSLLVRCCVRKKMRGRSRSPSPPPGIRSAAPGYEQYQKSLLEVPWPPAEYGEASSDDLSSEWDSDVQEPPTSAKVSVLGTVQSKNYSHVFASWNNCY